MNDPEFISYQITYAFPFVSGWNFSGLVYSLEYLQFW